MSGATLAALPASLARPRIRRLAGLLVGYVAFLWFALVADRILGSGQLDGVLADIWRVNEDPAALAGQWVSATLLAFIRRVPDSGPQTLMLATTLGAGGAIGALFLRFRRAGWSVAEALAAVGLLAVHPAVLVLATTGQTLLLAVLLVGIVILCLDRAATVGDAQSLMALGLGLAALMLTAPDALYIVLPIAAILPFCLRGVQDAGSAAALYLITLFPAVIAVGGILLGAATMGEAPAYAFQRWLAPMHGSLELAGSEWLNLRGGRFLQPLREMAPLFYLAMPPALLALLALLFRPEERRRPVAALLALAGGPLSGASATLFWHTTGPLPSIAVGMAAVLAWTTSRAWTRPERLLWLVWLAVGVGLSWGTGWLWGQEDLAAWRSALPI
ncbi:hypothetical protein JMJ55_00240 [Belnapia sp. T6]|uniref:Glycosyltransferase RgtA/B/C/D-like domain-containing protein n=1 Tax=Belnapia mucosa TaxID=2804532 RepID=A0ABS1UY56_9PROT|nr:hypothetical protein [Belnapia mucosa]MBL6453726.1 hypothetical protein [Belnapia mucosa]